MFCEYDVVVIRALHSPERQVIGTDGFKRQPQVGDSGTIVHVLAPRQYSVESVHPDGWTIWLADFEEDELEAWSALSNE
jgi:hypothetical protein